MAYIIHVPCLHVSEKRRYTFFPCIEGSKATQYLILQKSNKITQTIYYNNNNHEV